MACNCNQAWALSEPWEHLPVTDDSLVTCALPMNLRLAEEMQKLGFGLVFDGEGGDESFQDNLSLQELGQTGNWLRILRILRTQRRWHATLLKI